MCACYINPVFVFGKQMYRGTKSELYFIYDGRVI